VIIDGTAEGIDAGDNLVSLDAQFGDAIELFPA
jgi:hypothetical protein